MPIISSIPKRYHTGFSNLVKLSNKDSDRFYKSLEKLKPSISPDTLATKISIKSLSVEDVNNIILAVSSLSSLCEKRDISKVELVDDVCKIIANGKIEGTKLPKNPNDFKIRLLNLLNLETIQSTAKASDLSTEYENIFMYARIITDIRPVFGSNIEDSPKSALLIHLLHIHYESGEDSTHKDIYIALDGDDIKSFKKILERAENKSESLKKFFNKSEIIQLNAERNI